MKTVLSLLIGRSGSKGLPDKNILLLNKKPTYIYSIEYSKQLETVYPEVDTVISSDYPIMGCYCKGRNIKFLMRSAELSNDTTKVEDVIYDSIKRLDIPYEYISLLYCDCPTRYVKEFQSAYEFLKKNPDYDGAMSVRNVKSNPIYMFPYDEDKLTKILTTSYRRQDNPKYMIHDGHTILFRYDRFKRFMESGKQVEYLYEAFGEKIKPIINKELVTTIDSIEDYKLAEKILK